jgi:two-component system chemotaxis response regulator CheB
MTKAASPYRSQARGRRRARRFGRRHRCAEVLLHDLPATWRMPMAVVLHLPENHESHLAEIFAQRLPIAVHEAADKMPLAVGSLYFAPPGYHLSIERERSFSLSCEAPVLFSRPSIDVLMASAADAYGPALAGFLLTGANDDGAEGLYRIHLAGGLTAVQDPKEALISTMPKPPSRATSRLRAAPARAAHPAAPTRGRP